MRPYSTSSLLAASWLRPCTGDTLSLCSYVSISIVCSSALSSALLKSLAGSVDLPFFSFERVGGYLALSLLSLTGCEVEIEKERVRNSIGRVWLLAWARILALLMESRLAERRWLDNVALWCLLCRRGRCSSSSHAKFVCLRPWRCSLSSNGMLWNFGLSSEPSSGGDMLGVQIIQ